MKLVFVLIIIVMLSLRENRDILMKLWLIRMEMIGLVMVREMMIDNNGIVVVIVDW